MIEIKKNSKTPALNVSKPVILHFIFLDTEFVYVMGQHAVQFVNLQIILLSEEVFHPIIYKLDKHVVLLLINYTVQISLQIILLRGAALTTR